MSTKPPPESSYAVLWAGENPALHEALLQELNLAGIPYADKPIGEGEVETDPLPIDWKPRFGFEVAVHHPDLSRAREILEKLLREGELADVELPEEDDTFEDEGTQQGPQPGVTGDQQPTISVWAGDNPKIIDFLTAALQENDIPVRTANDGPMLILYVPPSHAPRAREIVREIAEGAPPQ